MEKVEVNVNGLPLEGIKEVDFCAEKGCFLLKFESGEIQEIYIENK